MLTSLQARNVLSARSLHREQALWYDSTQHTPSLGCMKCPERHVCGGLHIAASMFSCLDHCCGSPASCDVVCRNHPNYVDRIREIGGFDLKTIPRAHPLPSPYLPRLIPLLYHGGQREKPFVTEAVCLPLYMMVKRRTGDTQFETRAALNSAFKVSSDTTIILTGTAYDPPLERWWRLGEHRRRIICALRQVGIALVTTPNLTMSH